MAPPGSSPDEGLAGLVLALAQSLHHRTERPQGLDVRVPLQPLGREDRQCPGRALAAREPRKLSQPGESEPLELNTQPPAPRCQPAARPGQPGPLVCLQGGALCTSSCSLTPDAEQRPWESQRPAGGNRLPSHFQTKRPELNGVHQLAVGTGRGGALCGRGQPAGGDGEGRSPVREGRGAHLVQGEHELGHQLAQLGQVATGPQDNVLHEERDGENAIPVGSVERWHPRSAGHRA